jgi:WD40 repeat protein
MLTLEGLDAAERLEAARLRASVRRLCACGVVASGAAVIGATSDGLVLSWGSGESDGVERGQHVWRIPRMCAIGTMASDGAAGLALVCGGGIALWRAPLADLVPRVPGTVVREVDVGALTWLAGGAEDTGRSAVLSVEWDSARRRLCSGSSDGRATVWDAGRGEAISVLHGHAGAVQHASFVPGGNNTVVTAGADGTARVFDVRSGRQALSLAGGGKVLFAAAVDAGA